MHSLYNHSSSVIPIRDGLNAMRSESRVLSVEEVPNPLSKIFEIDEVLLAQEMF